MNHPGGRDWSRVRFTTAHFVLLVYFVSITTIHHHHPTPDQDMGSSAPYAANFIKRCVPHAVVEMIPGCGHASTVCPTEATRDRIVHALEAMPDFGVDVAHDLDVDADRRQSRSRRQQSEESASEGYSRGYSTCTTEAIQRHNDRTKLVPTLDLNDDNLRAWQKLGGESGGPGE